MTRTWTRPGLGPSAAVALLLVAVPVLGDGTSVSIGDPLEEVCTRAGLSEGCLAAGGGVVLAAYTDPQTGNTGKLIARDDGLYCGWEASKNPYASLDFVPAYYFFQCWVNNPKTPATKLGGGSENAAAVGEQKVADFVPRADLQWTLVIRAYDVRVESTQTHTETEGSSDRWYVKGELDGLVEVGVHFIGDVPIPWIKVQRRAGLSGGYETTSWRVESRTETTVVKQRSSMMFSVQNFYVPLKPRITTLDWSEGKTWGCDALDLVEKLLGEREVSQYAVHLVTSGAPHGTLGVDLDISEFSRLTDRGAFDGANPGQHGFSAWFNENMAFDSTVRFDVDYEFPENGLSTLLGGWVFEIAGNPHTLRAVLAAVGEGRYLATLVETDVPPSAVASTTALVDAEQLAAHGASVGRTVVEQILGDGFSPVRVEPASPCGNVLDMVDEQAWRATATIDGLGASTTRATLLPVQVYLDLA